MSILTRLHVLIRSRAALDGFLAVAPVLAVAVLGTLATLPNLHWYGTLHRPSFRPPTSVFGPVWTLLYALMAWAFYRVLRSPDWMPDRPAAIRAFWLQLGLNLAWPIAFFALRSPRLSFVVILALLVAVVIATRLFRLVDRMAALCLVPYALWVLFAAILNLSIAIRN